MTFIAKMPAIQSKFYICVELGDARSQTFYMDIKLPPAIEKKLNTLISPPSYLRMKNYTLTGNEIAVLEGSSLDISTSYDRNISSALINLNDKNFPYVQVGKEPILETLHPK